MAKKSLKNNILLDVEHLTFEVRHRHDKNRKEAVLEGVNFQLNFDDILGVSGKQDSGKTLFANLLVGAVRPTAGNIIFNGQDISAMDVETLRPIRHDINIVPAHALQSLNPAFTIGDNIIAPLLYLNDMNGIEHRLAEICDRLNIPSAMLKFYPDELTSYHHDIGLIQFACLARALITRPKLLVIDDITAQTNMAVEAKLIGLLPTLAAELNFAIIFISPDLRLMQPLCDEIMILDEGKVAEYTATSEFFFKPRSKAGKFLADRMLLA